MKEWNDYAAACAAATARVVDPRWDVTAARAAVAYAIAARQPAAIIEEWEGRLLDAIDEEARRARLAAREY